MKEFTTMSINFEFTVKNRCYVALFEGGVTVPVMTEAELAKVPAVVVAAAFKKIVVGPSQREDDDYLSWPEVSHARLMLGFVPRPLAASAALWVPHKLVCGLTCAT